MVAWACGRLHGCPAPGLLLRGGLGRLPEARPELFPPGARKRRLSRAAVTASAAAPQMAEEVRLHPGSATAEGTALFVRKFDDQGGDQYSTFLTRIGSKGQPMSTLHLSSIGMGTYLGPETDIADSEYEEAVEAVASLGLNVLDTAANYRFQRSERAIGRALKKLFAQGQVSRAELVVCTKAGFITYDGGRPANSRKWIEETLVRPGVIAMEDVVAGCHCMTPQYLVHQISQSRRNLGLQTLDLFYIHNPETQLSRVSRKEFDQRILRAFETLEKECSDGHIGAYGVATWQGFRCAPDAREHLSLEDLLSAAEKAGGKDHNFRVVQLPINLAMMEALRTPTQPVKGELMTFLSAARMLGLYVVASASLKQAQLTQGLTLKNKQAFRSLGENVTDAQCALHFVRSAPGVGTALVGMRNMSHVGENAAVLKFSKTKFTL
eukprot:SM000251S08831  [mRNA]  locus=s251:9035:11435:- [translate_table: standard]